MVGGGGGGGGDGDGGGGGGGVGVYSSLPARNSAESVKKHRPAKMWRESDSCDWLGVILCRLCYQAIAP